ncbi:MAG TPA: response regulator [Bryobacteraceae bacterium]|nr:response regulator [Bryobacteraceae bacterium]
MLRILHLEDRQEDAFLIENAILNWGIPAEFIVVRDRPEFVSALEQSQFDLILADNGLPGFDGLAALKMVRQQFPSIGFICVSGAAGENQTRASFQAGATDYVLKDDLSRLVATVRREWDRTQLLRMNRGMARLIAAVQELSLARDLDGVMAIVRRAGRELTGADGATFVLREGDLCHYADEDAVAPLWKGQKFPLSACISGWVMLNRQAAVIEDIYADPRIPADAYRPTFVKSLAMVPIRTEAPVGAIGNYWAAAACRRRRKSSC